VPNEFEPTSENQALKDLIIERIQREGGINFRDFMEMALYQPHLGYYTSTREKIGRAGDYLTSPEVSPTFGAMVSRQLNEMWDVMGRPVTFQIVEAGAGTAALCRDILRWARGTAPDLLSAIEYVIVEVSPALAARQTEAISGEGLGHKVSWAEAMPTAIEGCILTNELLDSMPVHRVSVESGRLQEVFVTWDGGRFVEELRAPSSSELGAYFATLGLLPGEGCRAEVNLAALDWMRGAANALRRGFVLTFDYGYEAGDLFAPWRREGTLLCFYSHNPSADPYSRIGRQDMTSHIDFTSVRRSGEQAGASTIGIVSQAEFLTSLGIGEAVSLRSEGEVDLEGYYSRRRAVMELLDPAGLGRIRVLAQHIGMEGVRLRGLGGEGA
jgi:SAM-dependent MidA family methyltransferase